MRLYRHTPLGAQLHFPPCQLVINRFRRTWWLGYQSVYYCAWDIDFLLSPVPVCLFVSIKTKKKRQKNNLLRIMWIFHFLEGGSWWLATRTPPIHSLGNNLVYNCPWCCGVGWCGWGGGVKNVLQRKKSQSPPNINSPPSQFSFCKWCNSILSALQKL